MMAVLTTYQKKEIEMTLAEHCKNPMQRKQR